MPSYDTIEREALLHRGALDLESQKHRRLCIALILVAGTAALFGAIAVWSSFQRAEWRRMNRRTNMASHALDRLNSHLKSQQKHISTGCESTLLIMRRTFKLFVDSMP
jgi:hypothetical protein